MDFEDCHVGIEGQRAPKSKHSSLGRIVASEHSSDYISGLLPRLGITDHLQALMRLYKTNRYTRPLIALGANEKRMWKNKWPLVTEFEQ